MHPVLTAIVCVLLFFCYCRTKAAVRELDNLNYRKMKKILMVDCETESNIGDAEDTPDEQIGGDSSKSNSITSEHSLPSVDQQQQQQLHQQHGVGSGLMRNSSRSRPANAMSAMHNNSAGGNARDSMLSNVMMAGISGGSGSGSGMMMASGMAGGGSVGMGTSGMQSAGAAGGQANMGASMGYHHHNSSSPVVSAHHHPQHNHNHVSQVAANAVAEHGANNFATIRTTSIVTKQQKEHMQVRRTRAVCTVERTPSDCPVCGAVRY